MRISLFTLGSQGDVKPYLILAAGLVSKGHEVILFTESVFAPLVQSMGLKDKIVIVIMTGNMQEFNQNPSTQKLVKNQDFYGLLLMLQSLCDEGFAANSKLSLEICSGVKTKPDIIISHFLTNWISIPFAEGLRIPCITVVFCPTIPTSDIPNCCMIHYPLIFPFSLLNLSLSEFSDFIFTSVFKKMDEKMQHFQKECNASIMPVSNVSKRNFLLDQLTLFSSIISPVSYDTTKYVVHKCGPLLDSATVPFRSVFDADSSDILKKLSHFLQAASNQPPVYIGFGSMAGDNLHRVTLIALESVMKLGRKAVLHAGWAGLSINIETHDSKDQHLINLLKYVKENVFELNESVPHYWLFPQCSVIVHHGGSGTSHAALAAGKPQVICPVLGDQFYWAYRVGQVGFAPKKYVFAVKITELEMTGYIQEMLIRSTQNNAEKISEIILAENGLDKAVQVVEDVANKGGNVFWESVYKRQNQIAYESKRNTLFIIGGIVLAVGTAIVSIMFRAG